MSAAIGLAVLGAACIAVAAALQHRAVGAVALATPDTGLGLRGMRALARRPGWLAGFGLAGIGAALHTSALVLAPTSVVQPVGVLAVPFAVMLAAVRHRRRPGAGVLAGAALTVTGVAAFVTFAAGAAVVHAVPAGAVPLASALAAGLVLALVAVAVARPRPTSSDPTRCVAFAAAGAVSFGLVSALLRAVSLQAADGPWTPPVLGAAAMIAVAAAVGGWSVQQGFASGPPEVVVACLTVIDPIVAVVLGTGLLGEGVPAAPLLLMLGCAAAAAAGVVALVRHHPDAAGRGPAPPVRPLLPVR